jgi:hypothetical protein
VSAPGFKPSDMCMWRSVFPLIDTFGPRAELEFAAALVVIASEHHGNAWQPILMKQMGEAMRTAGGEGGCLHHLVSNPFLSSPDYRGFEVLRKTVRGRS